MMWTFTGTDLDDMIYYGKMRDVDIVIGCTVDEGANEKVSRFGGNMCSQVRAFATMQHKNGKKPVYAYVFDREQPGDDNPGVPHSCDNRYQFGTLDGSWRPYTAEDWALAEKMQKYWANFARTGDPNGDGLEPWLPYTEDKLAIRLAVDGCTMTDYNEVTGGKLEKLEAELLAVFEK